MTRLGPGHVFSSSGRRLSAYDVTTGALLPVDSAGVRLDPDRRGGTGGRGDWREELQRHRWRAGRNLASFDLETGQLEPWTAALPDTVRLERLETDGTSLIGATSGAQFFKIDPLSGAVLGTLDFGSTFLVTERVAGDRIVVVAGHSLLGVIAIADWSQRSMPLSFEGIGVGVVHDLEVLGNTAYLAGRFGTVNGATGRFLAALGSRHGRGAPVRRVTRRRGRVRADRQGPVARGRAVPPYRRRAPARPGRLDPITGRALAWNPDAPGGATLDVGSDGTLFVAPSSTIGGRSRGRLAAFSGAHRHLAAVAPAVGDERVVRLELSRPRHPLSCPTASCRRASRTVACYPAALPSPTAPAVTQCRDPGDASRGLLPAEPPPGRASASMSADARRERPGQLRPACRCHRRSRSRSLRDRISRACARPARPAPACRRRMSRLRWARRMSPRRRSIRRR